MWLEELGGSASTLWHLLARLRPRTLIPMFVRLSGPEDIPPRDRVRILPNYVTIKEEELTQHSLFSCGSSPWKFVLISLTKGILISLRNTGIINFS